MGLISLKLQSFQFLIGTFDASGYVKEFGVSIPLSDYNRELLWSGSFTVAYTVDAKANGLTSADFDQNANPLRWEDGQSVVKIKLNGFDFPWLYIKDYVWNIFDNTGSGTLIQLPELLKFDRVGDTTQETRFGLGVPLKDVVTGLILQAGRIDNNQIVPPSQVVIPDSIVGSLCVQLISTNPLADAQKFVAANAQFIYQNNLGIISTIGKPEPNAIPLFHRGIDQLIPDVQSVDTHFAADKVIVSGSKEVGRIESTPEVNNPNDQYDNRGRPKAVRTITSKNLGEIFPDEYPKNESQIIVASKVIFYRYADTLDIQFSPGLHLNASTIVSQFVSIYPSSISRNGKTDSIQTITVEEKIIAEVFSGSLPDDNDLASLPSFTVFPVENPNNEAINQIFADAVNLRMFAWIIGNLTIETEEYRISFLPAIAKFPDATYATFFEKLKLVIDQHELLKTPLNRSDFLINVVNPSTGKAQALEPLPRPEQPQLAPNFTIDTVTFKSEFNLEPTGYNTFLPKQYSETFGFLDSQAQADQLARAIAYREWGRKRGRYWSMRLPKEWMETGFKPFPVCDLFDSRVVIENPSLVYQSDPPSLYFRFLGEKLASIAEVPLLAPQQPFIPTGLLQVVPTAITAAVGSVINLPLVGVGGTPPYTWSGLSTQGLSISNDGVITGTIANAFTGTWAITITDSLSNSVIYQLPLNFFITSEALPIVIPQPIKEISMDLSATISNVNLSSTSDDLTAQIVTISTLDTLLDLYVTYTLTLTSTGGGGGST